LSLPPVGVVAVVADLHLRPRRLVALMPGLAVTGASAQPLALKPAPAS